MSRDQIYSFFLQSLKWKSVFHSCTPQLYSTLSQVLYQIELRSCSSRSHLALHRTAQSECDLTPWEKPSHLSYFTTLRKIMLPNHSSLQPLLKSRSSVSQHFTHSDLKKQLAIHKWSQRLPGSLLGPQEKKLVVDSRFLIHTLFTPGAWKANEEGSSIPAWKTMF